MSDPEAKAWRNLPEVGGNDRICAGTHGDTTKMLVLLDGEAMGLVHYAWRGRDGHDGVVLRINWQKTVENDGKLVWELLEGKVEIKEQEDPA